MSGTTPEFGGFRRIVQGEDSIAVAYDTGQGQGFQRVVNLQREPSHEPDPSAARGLTRPLGGPDAGHRDHELLAQVHIPTGASWPGSRGRRNTSSLV